MMLEKQIIISKSDSNDKTQVDLQSLFNTIEVFHSDTTELIKSYLPHLNKIEIADYVGHFYLFFDNDSRIDLYDEDMRNYLEELFCLCV